MATITTDNAFQWVFNNAATIRVNRRPVVAQTIARDGTVRSTNRGGNVWRFTVEMPNGYRYSEYRDYIQALDTADRLLTGNVTMNHAGSTWITEYQGGATATEISNITAKQSASNSSVIALSNLTTIADGVTILQQGDFVQLTTGGTARASVYTVAADAIKSGSTLNVTINRPLLNWDGNTSPSYGLKVGNDVRWELRCVRMPSWTLNANQLVQWDGAFEFVEDLVAGRAGNI
jgi:hypothetical protein